MSSASPTHDRNLRISIFIVLLASYAYFHQAGGWNENSRMDVVRAIVDDHTLAIDRFHENTGDKARSGGHYYSDKAPGLALAAVPAYTIVRLARGRFDSDHDFVVFASYAVTVLSVGVASALLGVLLYRAARRIGASESGALVAALAWGLGTPAFPFSTMLFGHQLAALLCFGAFALLARCRDRYRDHESALAGLLCASAALTELPAAPVVLILAAYHASIEQRARRLLTFSAGALVPAVVLAAYFAVAFGSPLRPGYALLAHLGSRAEMTGHGFFGMTHPRIGVLFEIGFGIYRGLLPYSPVLALAVPAFVIGFSRHATARRELVTALAVVGYFLLMASSYEWWQGGSSFGCRHILPMLPFLALPLGLVADARPRLFLAVSVVSVAAMTVVTSVQPKPSDRIESPFFDVVLPSFMRGNLAAGNVCPDTGRAGEPGHRPLLPRARHDAFNLGMLLGGRGIPSLGPLLGLWAAAAFAFASALKERRLASAPGPASLLPP